MNDAIVELHSGSEIILLARAGAMLADADVKAQDCLLPALMRALAMPDNMFRLRANWSAVCSHSMQIRQFADEELAEKLLADVAIGRVTAALLPVETFAFASGAKRALGTPPTPPEIPKQRVTPSSRLPQPPKVPQPPKLPGRKAPELPTVAMPEVPELPPLPVLPDPSGLKEQAEAQAAKLAGMDALAKERALADELTAKARKAEEIAKKAIALCNASREEIAAFAMQMAAEYGEDIPPEYREMLREHGNAEDIRKAEDKAQDAADTASDVADKL